MSILDEADGTLYDLSDADCRLVAVYAKLLKDVDKRVSDVRVVPCSETISACAECIGHKYNLKHGCPICGGSVLVSVSNSPTATYRCNECELVIASCGQLNVKAMGIIDKIFRIEDDTI